MIELNYTQHNNKDMQNKFQLKYYEVLDNEQLKQLKLIIDSYIELCSARNSNLIPKNPYYI